MPAPASKRAATAASKSTPPPEAAPAPTDAQPVDPAQRHLMITEAAFFIAQSRGFSPHREIDDWLEAEREIHDRLSKTDL